MKAYKRAKYTKRNELMKPQKKQQSDTKVRFITTDNSGWQYVKKALTRFWDILCSDTILSNYLPLKPFLTY